MFPKMVPLWGRQTLGKAMNSNGFVAFRPIRVIYFTPFLDPNILEVFKENEQRP